MLAIANPSKSIRRTLQFHTRKEITDSYPFSRARDHGPGIADSGVASCRATNPHFLSTKMICRLVQA